MNLQTIITSGTLLVCIICLIGCKKKGTDIDNLNVQPVYYDVPFEITTKDSFYLTQGAQSIGLKLVSIYDDRATGALCATTTGGQADIKIAIREGTTTADTCFKSVRGCSNGQEYDTINPLTPKCVYSEFIIYLLKLNPYDKKETDISKYSVKYVIKKQEP